jgi:hypothetical protein
MYDNYNVINRQAQCVKRKLKFFTITQRLRLTHYVLRVAQNFLKTKCFSFRPDLWSGYIFYFKRQATLSNILISMDP